MKKNLLLLSAIALLIACNGPSGGKGNGIVSIDGRVFTEDDLATRLSAKPEHWVEEDLRNPEERRKNFENVLHDYLFSLAGQRAQVGNKDSLNHRLNLFDQRVMTQYYFDVYIGQYDMQPYKEIEDFYNANPSRFSDDSGRVIRLSKIINLVGDSLLISRTNLDSFYQANQSKYIERAHCEASIIQVSKLSDAKAALKTIQSGTPFGEAAGKFSTHYTKSSQGRLGRINKGGGALPIGPVALVDSLLFGPNPGIKPGETSRPIPNDTNFVLVHSDNCAEDSLPPLSSRRAQVAGEFVQQFRQKHAQSAFEDLKAKYKVQIVNLNKIPTESEIKAYYEQNKEAYESPETFELYDIEVSKKDKVVNSFKAIKNLDGFKALASKVSENTLTQPQGGYLGVVKRDFCLPYGIGMFPALFPELDKLNQGKMAEPLQNSDTQKWHFFWLAKKEPRKQKILERVHTLVKADLEANRVTHVNPDDELATFVGGVLRESDVLFLRGEIPADNQDRYSRETLVNYLLTWRLVSNEAKALGLDTEKRLIAQRLRNEDDFWGHLYQDSVLNRSYGMDTALLAKTFMEHQGTFTRDTTSRDWHNFTRDIAAYLNLTSKDFDLEYVTNPEHYLRDTLLPPMSAIPYEIFQNTKPIGYRRLDQKVMEDLKARFHVQILDASLGESSLEPATESYKLAQNLHYDRKLNEALDLYGKLRDKFPDRATLQDSICFGMAQIYLEQEHYQPALAEYRRAMYLYPNNPDDYKAMFMVGFIYSEHLKKDSAAVLAFEKMLEKHPHSDLSDDADWMIRNIRSGGKLMPKLEGDSTSVAPQTDGGSTSPTKKSKP